MRPLIPSLILAVGLACGGTEEDPKPPARPAPVPVPTVVARKAVGPPKLVDATRLRQELSRSAERPRVYNFWATWCPPCLAEMPLLRQFAIAHPEIDLVMVNVDAKALHEARVQHVIRENALMDVAHLFIDADDPNPILREAVPSWPEQIPLTLVVDRNGREVERFVESLDNAALLEAVARAR